jgi:ADP-heptose:LPS heptosyltransferase
MPVRHPKILVIRRRYLGDIVLLGCVLRNLRLHWPEARLTVLVERDYAPILGLNPDTDEALELPGCLAEWPGFLRRLRRARFSHVIDLDNTEKTAAITRFSGASFRLALHHDRIKLRPAYTHTLLEPLRRHPTRSIVEHYLRALDVAGVPVRSRESRLEPRAADLAAMGRLVGDTRAILLVHPGSRSTSRIWPAERFAAVCDRVQDELGARVVLVGGPGEQDLVADIRGRARTRLQVFSHPPTLPELAALARLSRAVLCHDSGPMHVAATVGTPVIALFGSQEAGIFPPNGDGHTLVRPSLPCAACVAPGHCVPHDSYRSFCVRLLTVDEVFAAVAATLEWPPRAAPAPQVRAEIAAASRS